MKSVQDIDPFADDEAAPDNADVSDLAVFDTDHSSAESREKPEESSK